MDIRVGVPVFRWLLLLVVVMATLDGRYKEKLTLRWWALPVFVLAVLASFPFSVITRLYLALVGDAPGAWQLAIAVREVWWNWGWVTLFVWPLALVLILVLGGVRFARRRTAFWSIGLLTVGLVLLGVVEGALFPLFGRWPPDRHRVATTVSPDGHWRALAFRRDWVGRVFLDLECEPVVSSCLFSHYIGACSGYGSPDDMPSEAPHQVFWSRDSKVVGLSVNGVPVLAYDFDERLLLRRARRETCCVWEVQDGGRSEWIDDLGAGAARVRELLAAHGGLAPAIPTSAPAPAVPAPAASEPSHPQ